MALAAQFWERDTISKMILIYWNILTIPKSWQSPEVTQSIRNSWGLEERFPENVPEFEWILCLGVDTDSVYNLWV